MPRPSRRILAALPLALVLAGCSGETSYDDRDWSAVGPVSSPVPDVREPDLATTRSRLAALDPCAVGAAGSADALAEPGQGDACTVDRGEGSVEVLTDARYFVDGSGPDAVNALDSRERIEVAGFAAWVGEGPVTSGGDDAPCAVVVPASLELALAVVDSEDDCAVAQQVAEAALADLDAVVREGRTLDPPVFYAADETDPGGEGACSELGDQIEWLCAPVGDVEVPDDPVDLIRHGEADPGLLCVPALEAARATAAGQGRSWVAVTTAVGQQELAERASYDGPRQCTLLEAKDDPDAAADADPVTIIVTARRQALGTRANTEVADHPAYHSEQSGTWEVALTDVDDHGFLRVEVLDAGRQEPDWAKAFVADLVERAFGG
ncbi:MULTISPECIES: hypothetical protein [unclassified Nocardioides]|uniref:hypothetical protein n=1 Tax=unclassified Nocardioides TaxID=2615069 RepID=UPI000702C204|nr:MULTISPECIES: hypothetical protein [unclassified Nocardioides]KRC53136.1 hypothetical protein ASE19_12210 [Nocardioides sp. Root79]KRC72664.1 hypothetical protein ASE20_08735 [Nocardioides sp. Root240]